MAIEAYPIVRDLVRIMDANGIYLRFEKKVRTDAQAFIYQETYAYGYWLESDKRISRFCDTVDYQGRSQYENHLSHYPDF